MASPHTHSVPATGLTIFAGLRLRAWTFQPRAMAARAISPPIPPVAPNTGAVCCPAIPSPPLTDRMIHMLWSTNSKELGPLPLQRNCASLLGKYTLVQDSRCGPMGTLSLVPRGRAVGQSVGDSPSPSAAPHAAHTRASRRPVGGRAWDADVHPFAAGADRDRDRVCSGPDRRGDGERSRGAGAGRLGDMRGEIAGVVPIAASGIVGAEMLPAILTAVAEQRCRTGPRICCSAMPMSRAEGATDADRVCGAAGRGDGARTFFGPALS